MRRKRSIDYTAYPTPLVLPLSTSSSSLGLPPFVPPDVGEEYLFKNTINHDISFPPLTRRT